MTEYAVLPLADYQDTCEAVREKTGHTEGITSGEMAGLIRGIETAEGKITLYEPECSISGGVVTAPLPEGYDTETFLEKLVFLELEVNTAGAGGIFVANTRMRTGTRLLSLCMNSSGGLAFANCVHVSDTRIQWAVDQSDLWNTDGPTMRMGLL